MFGQSLLSAFGSTACTTDTNQLFTSTAQAATTATYELNGNVNSIGNVYNGTVSSGTAAYTTGVFGQAADFSNWNISVPNLAADLQNTAFSISFWATPGNSTSYYLMAAGSSGGTRKGFLIGTYNGTLNIRFNNLTTNYFDINASMPSGFNHYVCSFDNTTNTNGAKIYVNGVLTTQGTSTGLNNFTFSTSTFFIGSEPTDSGQGPSYTSSNLDQLRIFKSAISQDVVTALYNETTTTAQSASVSYQLANPNSIAYYKMSDATDQLGNYNGTATNVNFNTEGKFGFAGAFNGSSSIINLGDHNVFSPSVNPLSFSLWIKKSTSDFNCIYSKGASGSYEYALFISGSGVIELVAYTLNASSSVSISTSASYSDGNWHHVVAIYDPSGSFKIYVDGSQQATSSTSLSMGNSSNALNIGKKFENNVDILNGSLDQIRIYDSAISAADVTTLYEEVECPIPSDTLGVCNYPIPATSLYQLQGPTILDNCGNYPGTIVGGATFTSGKFGNALDLTTSSTYAQLQTLPSSWSANPCSLSVWVNMRTLTSGWSDGSYIFSAKADWRLQFTSNSSSGITFGKWNSTYGNNGNNELKSAVPSLNTWYHVVVTDNQANDATGNLKLYINGVLEDSQIGYASPRTFSGYASIGASGEGRNGINGQIDQLRLFPYILTQADVTKLYNE